MEQSGSRRAGRGLWQGLGRNPGLAAVGSSHNPCLGSGVLEACGPGRSWAWIPVHDLTFSHGITLVGMGGGAAGEVGLTSPRQSRPSFSSRRACLGCRESPGDLLTPGFGRQEMSSTSPAWSRFGGAGSPAVPVAASGGGPPLPPHAPSAASFSEGSASCPTGPCHPLP